MDSKAKTSNVLEMVSDGDGAECIGRLADSFEASARRWELIVYPSLVAFILLAAYGFYLIYNLTHDIADVSKSVREMTSIVTKDLGDISKEMSNISSSTVYMKPMAHDMRMVATNINDMNTNMSHMQYNMWQLNRNVSTPFNMVEKMVPFGSSRPYGRSSSRITPPLYPRAPYSYSPDQLPGQQTASTDASMVSASPQVPAYANVPVYHQVAYPGRRY
jgi:hypothetical protein